MSFSLVVLSMIFIESYSIVQEEFMARLDHFNLNDKNLAIQGYDPVTYFEIEGPLKGNKNYNLDYKGVTYYFISNKNKEIFQEMPEKYEPSFGGWCAYALGNTGEKVKVDPETYKIIDCKIYLFYNFIFNNTLEDWNEDEKKLKELANKNWRKFIE